MKQDTPDAGQIRFEVDGPLAFIGIDRPHKLNGFSPEMVCQLSEAFHSFEHDNAAQVAVLYGVGANFTAGVQLDRIMPWFAQGRHLGMPDKVDPYGLRPPFRTKPVVAAVQGLCFTVGIELTLAADIVVAARNTRFGQLEVGRGILANHGATLRIVERAGWGNAMRYLLTGDEFDADTAFRLGLIQEIVEDGAQRERATELARKISSQAPLAVRETLRSARTGVVEGWDAAIAELGPRQASLAATEDAAEGLMSFLDKRKANFSGR